MDLGFKSFITENEIEEKKKIKQKIWEQTRTQDQPLEAPEEEYDPRTLYERLKEQKDKKQMEFDESSKLKNLIRGLDNDEITFLEMVDESKKKNENKKLLEEQNAIEEFQKHIANFNQTEQEKKLNELKKSLFINNSIGKECTSDSYNVNKPKKRQADLLANAIKRKPNTNNEAGKKIKKDNDEEVEKNEKFDNLNISNDCLKDKDKSTGLKVLGILPGLSSYYSDSSESLSCDSDASNNEVNSSEFDQFNLCRKTQEIKKCMKIIKKKIKQN